MSMRRDSGSSSINSINRNRNSSSVSYYNEETEPLLPSYDDVRRKEKIDQGSERVSTRHVLAFMAFLGFMNVYAMRVNLSVALVAMVNHTVDKNSTVLSDCPDPNGNSTKSNKDGEFEWDEDTQGIVLGAFFYGYITTQLPGGWLASKYGGKRVFGYGVLCTAVLTILTPFAARFSVYLFIALRILEGIGEGVTFPAMHAMWGNWAPIWERSKLVAFSYAGAQLGTVVSLPISGFLCGSDLAGGWPSVFYIFGSVGCLWFWLWMLLVHDTPAQHPRISKSEREYIENSIGKKEELPTPWKKILTCPAVWGLTAAHVCNNWGFYVLLTCLPTYMKDILKFDIKENGFLSAIPYLCCWLVQNVSGVGADYLRTNGYLSTRNTRKLFNTVGLVLPGVMLIIVSYVGCDHVLAMVFLTLSIGFSGCTVGGYGVNHLDLAPRFAGVLMGITNAMATIPGFLGPAMVGILTNHKETRHQWQTIFYINASICFTGSVIYNILGRGEQMSWGGSAPQTLHVAPTRSRSHTPPPEYESDG